MTLRTRFIRPLLAAALLVTPTYLAAEAAAPAPAIAPLQAPLQAPGHARFGAVMVALENQGYRLLEAETEDRDRNGGRAFEVKAISVDGRKVELKVDAASGEILRIKEDD